MMRTTCNRRNKPSRTSQRGMGATVILFTIALIVLVGAALAYASRSNPNAITTQGAKLQASLLLKQSADYRDAYSRYIFDGNTLGNMTFSPTAPPATDLLYPASQYGSYQAPPVAAMATSTAGVWTLNKTASINGVGTVAADPLLYIDNVAQAVCEQVNLQLYGSAAADTATTTDLTATVAWPVTSGRSIGCFRNGGLNYVFYATLGEG